MNDYTLNKNSVKVAWKKYPEPSVYKTFDRMFVIFFIWSCFYVPMVLKISAIVFPEYVAFDSKMDKVGKLVK